MCGVADEMRGFSLSREGSKIEAVVVFRKGNDLHDLNAPWHLAILLTLPATLRRSIISVDIVAFMAGREDQSRLIENHASSY